MISGEAGAKEENERQYRVVDQILSMHALYRDSLERRAFWLNTTLVATSLFLAVFAFVGDQLLGALGLDPLVTRLILGLIAVAVLVAAIMEFRVDWRSAAARHADAASRLSVLKAAYRKAFANTGGSDAVENSRLTAEYAAGMAVLPPIPDRGFNTLKARHKFKRLLSQRTSEYPKTPVWFLRLQLRIEGFGEALRSRGMSP